MNIKKLLLIIIPIALISFIAYRYMSNGGIKVKKVDVLKTEVVKSVSASGFVKSSLEADIAFPISGKVLNVFKKEGDKVRKGDLIAQINNEDLYFDAESAKKRKDSAQSTRDIYTKTYNNSRNDVGGSKLYDLNVNKLTDDLRVYDNAYKSALSNLKKTYLYAPFDGVLTLMPFDLGEYASVNQSVRVSDLTTLDFQADLDQEDYKDVKEGQSVDVILDAYPQDKFEGTVISIPSYVDEESSTKTFKLRVGIKNVDNKIVKGMTGDANIVISKEQANRALPFDAVYSEGDKYFVWVLDSNQKLVKNFIEIGLEGDTLTSIKSELPEYVVVPDSTAKNVKEGSSVTF